MMNFWKTLAKQLVRQFVSGLKTWRSTPPVVSMTLFRSTRWDCARSPFAILTCLTSPRATFPLRAPWDHSRSSICWLRTSRSATRARSTSTAPWQTSRHRNQWSLSTRATPTTRNSSTHCSPTRAIRRSPRRFAWLTPLSFLTLSKNAPCPSRPRPWTSCSLPPRRLTPRIAKLSFAALLL